MKRITLASLAILCAFNAHAQQFPQSLPANTVLGRLGVGPGPVQQIPFSALGPNLITNFLAVTAPLSITGLNLKIAGTAGQIPNGATGAFTATPALGVASTTSGTLTLANSGNSGTVTIKAPSTATTWNLTLPTTAGSNGQSLITDGAGVTSWAAGAGTVNSGTSGQCAYYASTAAAVSGNANCTFSVGGVMSLPAGLALGGAAIGGNSLAVTGTTLFNSAVTMSAALTYGGVTLTNAVTGTGKMVLDTAPTLGVTTVTSLNKVTITAPATGSTLTIADGKTLTDTSGIGASVLLGAAGGGFSAYGGASCTNQFVRSLSAAAAATCASVANTDLANSSLTIGSTSVSLGGTAATVAGLTLTAPTINGGTHTALTSLGIRSTGTGAFDLTLANSENLTAGRTLTLTLNNAPRTISLSGNVTTAADFTTAGANAITLTSTGTTNVTLPTTGTLAVQNAVNTFSAINTFSALQQFTDIKFSSGKLYPTADSTTALQVTKADGTTRIVNFDTTNARIGINKTAGSFDLDVNGAANIGGALTFATSTITGLTVNNSPSSSNDYLLYYSLADNAIRKCTVGSCAAAATAGVSSLNGLTGGLSNVGGNGISVSAAGSSVTITNSGVVSVTRQQFTAAGTVTYTPHAGLIFADVTCAGNGAGGGASTGGGTQVSGGGGGGGGSVSHVRLTAAQIGASKSVIIPTAAAGGVGGAANSGASGGDVCLTGSSCSVSQLCTGKGGAGGGGAGVNAGGGGGAGGVVGTGDYTGVGAPGVGGIGSSSTATAYPGGNGGGGYQGGGGGLGVGAGGSLAGGNGNSCGAGGAGGTTYANASGFSGGSGAVGCLLIVEYNSQ